MSVVSLTFDNGPDPEVTPLVLDVLKRREVRATFFVLGKNLNAAGLKLVERARSEGHWIGNHSFAHGTPLGDDERVDLVEREIVETEARIGAAACEPPLFRPFGKGKIGPHLLRSDVFADLIEHRYTCVLWNCVPEDWLEADAWAARALSSIAQRREALVVLHDTLPAAMRHLDGFVATLLEQGHTLEQNFASECLPLVAGRITSACVDIVR